MNIPVFLSYPKPFTEQQADFIEQVGDYLRMRGLEPRTLGVTDYDMDAPLRAIRRLMFESNGLITIALRRTFVKTGAARPGADLPGARTVNVSGSWLSSPWAQIEPAMAYQLGLPILLFREAGVVADGILEPGVVGLYLPEFDTSHPLDPYFASEEWRSVVGKWEGYVRAVVDHKGNPPALY